MQVIYINDIYEAYIRMRHITNMNGLVLWLFVYANDRLYVGNAGHIYESYIRLIYTNHICSTNDACDQDEWVGALIFCIWEWSLVCGQCRSYITIIYTTDMYELYPRIMHLTSVNGLVFASFVNANDCLYVGNTLPVQNTATQWNALQHTAIHCNTLQHTATHCNTLQHTSSHSITLHRTASHCNTLHHTASYCNTLQHTATLATHCMLVCMWAFQV